ncbi:type V CRISPR-associated protein Cas12k [Nostocaceae cyanobacterium CENA369]|uniref:Type V CRISPR-associated protein Cas12k n=1 Tax=Dendronalium phyllosphericum CENA369 TaxID=1725256 RepID=A0A8J7IFV9_9NOST|nr:type V CRISPR-associated protein Cas12k [Dendronalium phyllosphericum]MBH8577236.1 type V CRISPR-associated protein Cas12k [Dendronalium phyllosphericum CENA369]
MSRKSNSKSTSAIHRTIRCYLHASEDVLRKVWEEMTQTNTPLIVQLLKLVSEQPGFEVNKENGTITKKEITELRKPLTDNSDFQEQSGRLKSSADSLVTEVYSSWLALYQKRKKQKEGKEYFLNNILKSDAELVQESQCDLQIIRCKAQEILNHPEKLLESISNNTNTKKNRSSTKQSEESNNKKIKATKNKASKENIDKNPPEALTDILYKISKSAQDILTKCAVAYLIKNNNKVSDLEEDITKLEKRRTQKQVEIKRLEEQLHNTRLPNGRDITGTQYSQAFNNLMNQVPQDNEEFAQWIATFLKKVSNLPYPINYGSGDLSWYKNEKEKIFVYFNGWSQYHFQICCNKRQLHFFKRFLEDYKALEASEKEEEKLSGSLVTLRSAHLLWQEGKGKGEPWKVHKLALHCTYDARLLTAEGTEEVRQEKTDKVQKEVDEAKSNENLDSKQQKKLNKNKSSLSRLKNSFVRPSKSAYQGQSNIIVGVSLHPVELVTLVVVDANTKKILACKTVKELLGDAFPLLSRRRRQQVHFRKEREKAQKKDSPCHLGEAKLGEYVDSLLAKRIVEVAKEYQAGRIVLPGLKGIREIRTSAIQAKAETKFPGNINAQEIYVKEYNLQIHNWSYSRLQESIKSKAAELKISIKFGTQASYGTLQEKARDLALSA